MSNLQDCMQLLVLDLSKPVQPCTLSVLSQACQEWGFFYICNHGIRRDLFNRMYFHSKHLFSLPSECNLKLGLSSSIQTYTPPFIARLSLKACEYMDRNFMPSLKALLMSSLAKRGLNSVMLGENMEARWRR